LRKKLTSRFSWSMKNFITLLWTLLWAVVIWGTLGSAQACVSGEICRFNEIAEYRVLPPQSWDGKTPIGVFIFVHGHRSSAAEMIGYRELADAAHGLGLMLVAPQGQGDSWSTPGSPGEGRRDELAYMSGLLDDLARRFPLDSKRVVGSGFSQGASVIWEIACRGDGRFSAFVPVAGVWWQPMPKDCTAPPRPMLHIHGTADTVMPMTGRNLRDRWKQGDVMQAFATMRQVHACPSSPIVSQQLGSLSCSMENGCGSGKKLALCLHPGDHHTNPSWFMEVKGWLTSVL
jgi:polyhydroxybutyrate depolymerase